MNDQLGPDHNTTPRPPLVTDHDGRGWQAVAHGGLTPQERRDLYPESEEHFADAYSVRLTRRGSSHTQVARLTIEGARALADQLYAGADEAERTRNAVYARNAVDAEAERSMQQGDGSPPWERDVDSLIDMDTVYTAGDKHVHYRTMSFQPAVTTYHSHEVGGEVLRHVHGSNGWSNELTRGVSLDDLLADEYEKGKAVGGKLNPVTVPPPEQQSLANGSLSPRQTPGAKAREWGPMSAQIIDAANDERVQASAPEYSELPLKTDEIATAVRLGVRVTDIDHRAGPANSLVRARIAEFAAQSLDDVVAKAEGTDGENPGHPPVSLDAYSREPLIPDVLDRARHVGVPVAWRTDSWTINNARIRRAIALAEWDGTQA